MRAAAPAAIGLDRRLMRPVSLTTIDRTEVAGAVIGRLRELRFFVPCHECRRAYRTNQELTGSVARNAAKSAW